MRWIFVRNAVNFCKKCCEMWWIIYFHRIHRNHRISYNNSPQSPHFLQNLPKNLDPGLKWNDESIMYLIKESYVHYWFLVLKLYIFNLSCKICLEHAFNWEAEMNRRNGCNVHYYFWFLPCFGGKLTFLKIWFSDWKINFISLHSDCYIFVMYHCHWFRIILS